MATWFATASGNINSAGRWNSLPDGTGTALTWPPAVDDVLLANGRTVTVNVSVTVAELRNGTTGGAANGGYFNCTTAGVSVVANVYEEAGASRCLQFAHTSGIIYYVGNAYAGSILNAIPLFTSASGGTINVTGNIYAGSGVQAHGFAFTSGANMTANITGILYGGSNAAAECLRNTTVSTVTVTGNAIAGSAGIAASNTSTGSVSISGYAEASTGSPAINNVAQGVVSVGETRSASNGRPAVTSAFRYASATALVHKPIAADGSTLTMKPASGFALPVEATVRNGVAYGGDKVGTLTGCNRHHRMSI